PSPESEWSWAPRSNEWTVLAVIGPGPIGLWVNRPEHALLLGLPTTDAGAKQLRRAQRTLAFLDRGPGVTRVINASRDHKVLEKEMAHDRIVALSEADLHCAQHLPLPPAVVSHLRLRTDGATHPKLNDSMAWVVRTAELTAWRRTRNSPPSKSVRSGGAVLSALRGRRRDESTTSAPEELPPVSVYLTKIHLPITPAVG
ncbi:MAG: hypothetical protein KGI89_15870, partial [Euryarchaeota archaeon]|nr:hypothetical protein [Euryarchaeota archaeon]